MTQTITFYVFAVILILAAFRVITTRNLVQAALWLVLCFFTAAAIWLLLQAEFLAIVLVLVYVGAVMVLFLFVVMMLDLDFDRLRAGFRSYIPVGLTVGVLIVFEMGLILVGKDADLRAVTPPVAAPANYSNTRALGLLIYTDYAYPFEIAAVVLLVAIIAAIALTHRKRRETKYQKPGDQVRVRREDRLRVLNIPAEKREP